MVVNHMCFEVPWCAGGLLNRNILLSLVDNPRFHWNRPHKSFLAAQNNTHSGDDGSFRILIGLGCVSISSFFAVTGLKLAMTRL